MEFTYTATLVVVGEEDAFDVWKAAEYLQMQEAIKALNNKWVPHANILPITTDKACIIVTIRIQNI